MGLLLIVNIYFLYNVKVLNNNRATLFGYSYQVGLNYSMQPTLMPNDFLITKSQNSYNVDDIVTFTTKGSSKFITHRIIKITENGYITKGDNEFVGEDDEITNDDIIGKVVIVMHHLGAVLRIMQNPLGAIIIIAIIVVCGVLIMALSKKKNEENP